MFTAREWLDRDPEVADLMWRYLRQQWPTLSDRTRIEFTDRTQYLVEPIEPEQVRRWQDYSSPASLPSRRDVVNLQGFACKLPPKYFRPAPNAPMGWRSWWRDLFPGWREDVDDPEVRWQYGNRVHRRLAQLPRLALDTLSGRLKQAWATYHEHYDQWQYDYRAALREGRVYCGYRERTDQLFVRPLSIWHENRHAPRERV